MYIVWYRHFCNAMSLCANELWCNMLTVNASQWARARQSGKAAYSPIWRQGRIGTGRYSDNRYSNSVNFRYFRPWHHKITFGRIGINPLVSTVSGHPSFWQLWCPPICGHPIILTTWALITCYCILLWLKFMTKKVVSFWGENK